MELLDVFGTLFPGTTARYLMRRRLLDQVRTYEAAKTSRFRGALANQTSGDGVMDQTGDSLRQISRHLEENHDLTVAIFDDLVNNTIGAGIQVAPMVRRADGSLATEVNDRLTDLWGEFATEPETTREHGWEQVERMVARCTFRDGEIFIQKVEDKGGYRYPTPVRLALELLEADLIPMQAKDDSKNILHGIQTSDWNEPLAYFAFKDHPGNPLRTTIPNISDLKRMDAKDILHLKFSRRLRQRRGVPIIHAVINRLRDIKDYEESERIAAKVAADFTWFIEKSSETTAVMPPAGSNEPRNLQMQAGMGFELLPGEKVGTISHDRPNTALVNFREAMLRAVAGGTGTRFSSIARNYNGTYSAQRQELVEGAIAYRAHFAYFVRRFHRPVWARFVYQAGAAGLLRDLRQKYDPRTVNRVDFRAPALPWIDPSKEADAWRTLVEAGLESRQEIMRQRNRDPQKVWEELEEEQDSGLFASAIDTAAVPAKPAQATGEKDPEESDEAAAA